MKTLKIEKIKEATRKFVQEREWEQYQTPKNMSIALTIEAAELMEIFQWLNDEEVLQIKHNKDKIKQIKDEVIDIFYWIIRLSDVLDINLETAFWEKLRKNEEKYPIHLCRGNSKKYTELK